MYYIYGISGPSLLIESTDSMMMGYMKGNSNGLVRAKALYPISM